VRGPGCRAAGAWFFITCLKEGFSSVNWAFFTQLPKPVGEPGGGMANAIVGTLFAARPPCGRAHRRARGVFLSEYGSSRLNWWIRFTADVLNGVPSITWGMVRLCPGGCADEGIFRAGRGIVLGLMMIPPRDADNRGVCNSCPNGYRRSRTSRWASPNGAPIVQIVMRTALKRHRHRRPARAGARGGRNRAAALHRTRNAFWTHS